MQTTKTTIYHRLLGGFALAIGCLTYSNQVQAQEQVQNAPATTNNTPVNSGPLVVQGLPGTNTSQLVSRFNYISPLASLLSRPVASDPVPASSRQELSRYYRSGGRSNLLRMPEMFGDFRTAGVGLSVTAGGESVLTEMPLAGGIGGLRVAENNQALPANRVWFGYNHFHNAFESQASPALAPSQDEDFNRFVIASEILLDEGRTSLELRMAFGSAVNLNGSTGTLPYILDGDSIGNFSLILKRLLYADACMAWSMGLGVETPTGSDANLFVGPQGFELENDAVHLTPFMAYTERFGRLFAHAFTQLDIATGGNELSASTTGGPDLVLGEVTPQTLVGIDIGLGYWLLQPSRRNNVGLAAVTELHYTGALNDEDSFVVVTGAATPVGANSLRGTVTDVLNATAGLELSTGTGWALRTAVAAPLRDERIFDTEFILQVNRTF